MAFLAACVAVGAIVGGLLIGYAPVGGDPDYLYRPIKTELARSLRQGKLPFWSDKLGLGVPLVAESHVAAFYPLNWVFYRLFSVSASYRLLMWLHYVALVAATFAYARHIGITSWGAATAAVSFALCGFQTIHSSHECFYHALPYLPICLLVGDKFVTTGRWQWLGVLGLLWGIQITIGHFQTQSWTGALVLVAGIWRVTHDRLPLHRVLGLVVALGLGLGIACVQLVPSFELARAGGHLNRSFAELAFFSYPLDHWNELAVPGMFRNLVGGPEARYWFSQGTTGFEACLFVGTIPLILAIVGFLSRQSKTESIYGLWRVITIATFALATMPHWWPTGFADLLQVPGFNLFRCPARYTAITSLGLGLLAGRGFDQTIGKNRFRWGLGMAGLYAVGSFLWALALPHLRPQLRPNLDDAAIAIRVGIAAASWVSAMIAIILWRQKSCCAWVLFAMTVVEMGAFYHFASTIQWGWPERLPEASNVLSVLAKERDGRLVAGPLGNLPVLARRSAAPPFTGLSLPMPNKLLSQLDPRKPAMQTDDRWLQRFGVTHLVTADEPLASSSVEEIFHGYDFALDKLTYQRPGISRRRDWRVYRIRNRFPPVRFGLHVHAAPDLMTLVKVLAARDGIDEVWYLPGDMPPPATYPRAQHARVIQWKELAGTIEHTGAVEVILGHAYYPGWEVTINDGRPQPALQSNGGLLTARLDGKGVSSVSFQYRPTGMTIALPISVMMTLTCLAIALTPLLGGCFQRRTST